MAENKPHSIFNDQAFIRIQNDAAGYSQIGYSLKEYHACHLKDPERFPIYIEGGRTEKPKNEKDPSKGIEGIFIKETQIEALGPAKWRELPPELRPTLPNDVKSYPEIPPGTLRHLLEHTGKLSITGETLKDVRENIGEFNGTRAKLLISETAFSEGEKSLLAQIEKASAKIGLPVLDGRQVIPPTFIIEGTSPEPEKANAGFSQKTGRMAFTEHFVRHPELSDPGIQENIALHELRHGTDDGGMAAAHAVSQAALMISRAAQLPMQAGLGAGLGWVYGYAMENQSPENMNKLANAAMLGLAAMGTQILGMFVRTTAIGLMQNEELMADAAAIKKGDHPEKEIEYLKLSEKELKHPSFHSIILEAAKNPLMTPGLLAVIITATALGVDLKSGDGVHPSGQDRVKAAEKLLAERRKREFSGPDRSSR